MRKAMKMMLLSQSGKKPDKKKNCIKACQDCSAACDLAIQYINQHPEGFSQQLITLLTDCFSYTQLMAGFIERDSEFSKPVFDVGRVICERCIVECAKYPNVPELNKVSQECEKCINVCGACLG